MWKTHFIVCGIIVLIALPVYLIETLLLKKGGTGGFIMLDLTGIFIVPYLYLSATHVVVSSLVVRLYSPSSLLAAHLISGALSVALVVVGFVVYGKLQDKRTKDQWEDQQEQARRDRQAIELKEWWYVPDATNPTEVHMRIKFMRRGRFSGHIRAHEMDEYGDRGEGTFYSEDVPQQVVNEGDVIEQVYPLKILQPGKSGEVSITLGLYKIHGDSTSRSITIIFEENPERDFDGHFIYDKLPEPSRNH